MFRVKLRSFEIFWSLHCSVQGSCNVLLLLLICSLAKNCSSIGQNIVRPKDLKWSKLKCIVQKLVETCQHVPICSGVPVSVQCVLVPKRPIKRVRASYSGNLVIHFALATLSSFPGQQTNFVCLLEPRFDKLWNIYQYSPTQAWSVYGGLSRLTESIAFLFHINFCQSRKRPPWLSLIRAAQNMHWFRWQKHIEKFSTI